MQAIRCWLACLSVAIFCAAPVTAAAAEHWSKAMSRHFTVYSSGAPAQVKDFTEKLEKFDFLLRTVTDTKDNEPDAPVLVFMLGSVKAVQDLASNPNIAGFYETTDRNGYAVVSRATDKGPFTLGAQAVLFHEYAHHFMLHYFPAAYPAWYVEGFAEYYSTVLFAKDGSIHFGQVPMYRAPELLTMPLYPLDKLFARDTDALTRQDGGRYYGTAWLLTHYFYSNSVRGAEFTRYLKDMVKGLPDVTIENHFQGGQKALEKELRVYLGGKMFGQVLTPTKLPTITVSISALDDAHAALIPQELRLMHGVASDKQADFIQDMRAATAKFPASAYAQTMLAEAEHRVGHADAAMAASDSAMALDATFERGLCIRATLLLERAHKDNKPENWKAALATIVKANRADIQDPVPLVLYYRYQAMRGGPMPQIAFDGLYKAFELLPQNPNYRFMLASALANRHEYEQAAAILGPIAFSPHASNMREAAMRLQTAFKKAQQDGTPVPDDVEEPAPED